MATKIAIFGMGGVGGYFAAQLAAYYQNSSDVETYFIARSSHLEAIKKSGITLTTDHPDEKDFTIFPTLATDNPKECGVVDYVVYCTKNYSVEQNIEQLKDICDSHTIIVPFMNGIEGINALKELLPEVTVWSGCVYIWSKILEPGKIGETGNIAHYFFGSDTPNDPKCLEFEKLVSKAVRKVSYYSQIEKKIWQKFSYISVFGTISTHHNTTSDKVISDNRLYAEFKALSDEFYSVAAALGVVEENSIFENNVKICENSPAGSTSSMQRDYHSGRASELESLTGYICRLADKLGIETPAYDKAYNDLLLNKK